MEPCRSFGSEARRVGAAVSFAGVGSRPGRRRRPRRSGRSLAKHPSSPTACWRSPDGGAFRFLEDGRAGDRGSAEARAWSGLERGSESADPGRDRTSWDPTAGQSGFAAAQRFRIGERSGARRFARGSQRGVRFDGARRFHAPRCTGCNGRAAGRDATAAVAAVLEKGFAPDFTSKLTTSNDYVKLSNDFAVTFSDPTGITLGSVLSYAQDQSLTQHTELHTKTMTNNLNMPLRRLGVNFGISTFNRKTDQTARTISNASTSNQTDDKGADASLGVGRRLDRIPGVRNLGRVVRGFSVNGFVAHRANQAFQDIVATQGTGAGQRTHTGSGNSYGGGGGYATSTCRCAPGWGTTEIDNVDKSKTLPNGQTESTSEGDTTSVDVTVPAFWRAANIVFGYRAVRGNDSYTDQVRSSSGGQTGTIGNFALETKHTQNRALNFGLRLKPWSRADMGFTINAGRDSTTYDLRQNAFVDNKRVAWKFDSKWNLWLGTNVTFNYESSATDVNQDEGGKPNANTRRDESASCTSSC
jgi:hypothetical protein